MKSSLGAAAGGASGPAHPGRAAWLTPALSLLFYLSGISGLIYQTLWLRVLSLVFGVTIYAASTVLASFMAGLALGTLLAGRWARRTRRPLVWLGLVELGIGATALATPAALQAVSAVWVGMQAHLPEHLGLVTAARLLCASAVLVVPTMLMGATLPLVVHSSLGRGDLIGPRVGLLYACNTAGAITGAVLAGFVLIGGIGIGRSFVAAASINASVGIAALLLARRVPTTTVAGTAPLADRNHRSPAGSASGSAEPTRALRRLIVIVFGLSGFAALALEVVWFRVLVIFIPATTYAFTSMLAAVLAGIAAGSAAAVPVLRFRWNWVRVLGVLQALVGLLALAAMTVFLHLYRSGRLPDNVVVAALVVILPPAIVMGLAFPVGIRAFTRAEDQGSGQTAAHIAALYAANVGGAIGGAVAAGFLLVPALGSRGSLGVLAGLYVASGISVFLVVEGSKRSWAAAAAAAVTTIWLTINLPNPFVAVQGRRLPPGQRLFWVEEGSQTTATVYGRPMGGRVLYLDGIHQADDSAWTLHLHSTIGLLPAAIHPDPRRVLAIGLGGGVTPGALSQIETAHIDIVELSASVVRGAAWFRRVNYDVLRQPSVRLRLDDGRNYLMTTPNRYDVITADIIQPVLAGAGSLYSIEYFRLARRALSPGGLMLQWIGPRPASQYKALMRTFLQVFPDATLWMDASLLVGTTGPLRLERATFDRKLSNPDVRRALNSVDIRSFDDLLALYSAGPARMREFVGEGPVLTDDRPLVEYFLSMPLNEPFVETRGLRDDVRQWLGGSR